MTEIAVMIVLALAAAFVGRRALRAEARGEAADRVFTFTVSDVRTEPWVDAGTDMYRSIFQDYVDEIAKRHDVSVELIDPPHASSAEATQGELRRQSCAGNDHRPCLEDADFSGDPPVWWCGCQDYLWKRVAREETSG